VPEIIRRYMGKKDRTLTVYGKMNKSGRIIPQIRFEGQWLKTLGFDAGDRIRLDCEENRIIITNLLEKDR